MTIAIKLVSICLLVSSPLVAQQPEHPLVHMTVEPDHCFISTGPRPFRIDIKTSGESVSRRLGRGDIACANGELLSVRIHFLSGDVLRYEKADIRALISRARLPARRNPGGWLIGAHGLEYVSNDRYQRSRKHD
jgi:hypothetical protein